MVDSQNAAGLNELNMACLRAAVKLLERLELKVSEPSNTGDDSMHVVSRLFNKYSSALLASIESIDNGQNDGVVRIFWAGDFHSAETSLCLLDVGYRVRSWLSAPGILTFIAA